MFGLPSRSRFVIIGHYVGFEHRELFISVIFTTIYGFMLPVVDHVVPEVIGTGSRSETWVTTDFKGKQVVVRGAVVIPPNTTKRMAFGAQGFRDHRPMEGHVFTNVDRHDLVPAPTSGYVVNDYIFMTSRPDRITVAAFTVSSYPDIPDDDIIGVNAEMTLNRDSVPVPFVRQS